jgi:Lar family restriction alleviation protein
MSKELKPCPFCGNKEVGIFSDSDLGESDLGEDESGQFTAVCSYNIGGCGASGSYEYTREEAAARWNTRTQPEYKYATHEEWEDQLSDGCDWEHDGRPDAFNAARELKDK